MNGIGTDDRRAAGWSFVMENYATIERMCGKISRKLGTGLQAEELFNATILHLVETFRFDPMRGTAAAYIFWAVRECGQKDNRQRMIGRTSEPYLGRSHGPGEGGAVHPANDMDLLPAPRSGPRELEQWAEISMALDRLTDEEQEAVRLKADGWTEKEIKSAVGISMAGCNQRIYRARRRLGVDMEM